MKNEEKNIIKTLSYVSKINKTQKNIKKLFNTLIFYLLYYILIFENNKNIKFNYDENKNNIKFEEYYFNGIYIPKNIEFKDISSSSINIYWKIDDINNINIDKNKI